jgi:hypothetical protein
MVYHYEVAGFTMITILSGKALPSNYIDILLDTIPTAASYGLTCHFNDTVSVVIHRRLPTNANIREIEDYRLYALRAQNTIDKKIEYHSFLLNLFLDLFQSKSLRFHDDVDRSYESFGDLPGSAIEFLSFSSLTPGYHYLAIGLQGAVPYPGLSLRSIHW